jgi:hypothetical protein
MDSARTQSGKDSIFRLEVIENGLVVHRAGDNHVRAVRRALTACFAPCSTSGCIFETVRFQTVKSKPAFNMHWAMFEPMLPKPMNATFMMVPVATDHATLLRNARQQDTAKGQII